MVKEITIDGGYAASNVATGIVESAGDLTSPDAQRYAAGTVMHTAGYNRVWEKGISGAWVPIGGSGGSGSTTPTETDSSLTIEGTPADAKAVGDRLTEINDEINPISNAEIDTAWGT